MTAQTKAGVCAAQSSGYLFFFSNIFFDKKFENYRKFSFLRNGKKVSVDDLLSDRSRQRSRALRPIMAEIKAVGKAVTNV